MSRYGPPYDIPQRWDRDRFERFAQREPAPPPPPPGAYDADYYHRYEERDRPGRRSIAVQDRIDENSPYGRYEERDRFYEDDRMAPRPRRRTERELMGDVDPREAGMAMAPYRQSLSREEMDINRPRPARPGMLRRQSSLDTFDRKPARFDPFYPPGRPRAYERDYEDMRYRDYEPDRYRGYEIERERSMVRRKESIAAPVRQSRTKSISTRHTSPSSESSEDETVIESVHEETTKKKKKKKKKKGKTRMPKRLVRKEALNDLGYTYEEEENFFIVQVPMEKEQSDEVIEVSRLYNEGLKGTSAETSKKKVYRYSETVEEETGGGAETALAPKPAPAPTAPPSVAPAAPPTVVPTAQPEAPPAPPPVAEQREEVTKTEWVNPPTVVMAGAAGRESRPMRSSSPSAMSSISQARRSSPTTVHRSRSRRRRSDSRHYRSHSRHHRHKSRHRRSRSRTATYAEDRRTVYDDIRPPAPPTAPGEIIEDHRTIIEDRRGEPSHHGGALVVQEREFNSDREYRDEIARLEAEARALQLERRAGEVRDRAARRRRQSTVGDDYEEVVYRETVRDRSPPKNVLKVEKDRKGRMALVRSAE
ncbi:hypothetical protein K470DRAFT_254175 [Piedraia hortae CBS 480.64]|uniref:DUF8035 domain-containing protein n=1 Tax=Piedraia hortae CBS 480.64 TaxID=1314780 RepID=A0A6A7CAF5_9PEZI|nr:hypothetical protein K470DRAFT_254175 [Piedraia hortae CBS 480.64]